MADHPFEQLNDQRFQQFCQALLVEAFPGMQCLPVAQPDGGRDGLQRIKRGESIVFQVKFARNPANLDNPEKWAREVIAGELPKIKRLAARGAKEYKLITNLSATAHLDRGSLDRVQRAMDRLLPIPAQCWWRDDLNRRLENAFDLKLSYPELFTGSDFIRLLVERGRRDSEALRRRHAISAYLADQYEREREVRFKQAELSNELLGVFIDVPAAPQVSETLAWDSPATRLAETISMLSPNRTQSHRFDELRNPLSAAAAGAGSLLLDPAFQEAAPCVIIEGAPGQGKSTMLQYVCQVHRLRLLDKSLTEVDPNHAASPVRLPLKVDLRDLAQWLTNPKRLIGEDVPQHLRSLEGFLASQITGASGGVEFDVADLHAAIADSKVLLALDGLDEVVDISDRSNVIAAIVEGVQRLQPEAVSLQVVVTSRPASFVGAGSLPDNLFQHLRLQSIGRELIDTYAEKWMCARNLDNREKQDLKEILDAKLKQAHIRDLAHNPMQLAILLNLIHRRGRALPDQRTELYSSYMEIFLDREADKSASVRDHRQLLMTLHGHIAWLLHCQAEGSARGGRFSTGQIEEVVEQFLLAKGHPPDLFENLFGGVFDRVGALVSRIQDTYEFEVQPLREFFAARYLYQTAPHSAAGKRRAGTRPERFDAIARHPYWLNVTRFYAGSYDIGELSSLADRLSLLRRDQVLGGTSHPRIVSGQLLADWTFQQELAVQDRVVAPLVRDLKTRGTISEQHDLYQAQSSSIGIPSDCGGEKLAAEALKLLRKERRWDRRSALASAAIAQLPDPEDRKERWLEILGSVKGQEKDRWIRSSYSLRLTNSLRPADLQNVTLHSTTIQAILYAEQFEFFDDNEDLAKKAAEAILEAPKEGEVAVNGQGHPLPALAEALRIDTVVNRTRSRDLISQAVAETESSSRPGYSAVYGLLSYVSTLLDGESLQGRSELRPWNVFVEEGRRLFGDRKGLTDLAIVAAGVADRRDRGRGHDDLFDSLSPLCRRARHARLRSGDERWWAETLERAGDTEDKILALALCWTWASEGTLQNNLSALRTIQGELDDADTDRLLDVISRARSFSRVSAERLKGDLWFSDDDGPTLLACLEGRLKKGAARQAVKKFDLFSRPVTCHSVLDRLWSHEADLLDAEPDRWSQVIEMIGARYKSNFWTPGFAFGFDAGQEAKLPFDVARAIVKKAGALPVRLVASAEATCMSSAQAQLKSVGEIAARDRWFK